MLERLCLTLRELLTSTHWYRCSQRPSFGKLNTLFFQTLTYAVLKGDLFGRSKTILLHICVHYTRDPGGAFVECSAGASSICLGLRGDVDVPAEAWHEVSHFCLVAGLCNALHDLSQCLAHFGIADVRHGNAIVTT